MESGAPILINSGTPFSSQHQFAVQCFTALDRRASLVNLVTDRTRLFRDETTAVTLGLNTGVKLIDATINNLFPRLTFGSVAGMAKKAALSGSPVIFCSIDVPCLYSGVRSIVVIHDNPYTLFDRSLYSTSLKHKVIERMRMKQYSGFSRILTVSNYVRGSLLRYGVKGDVTVIHPPVDPVFKPAASRSALRAELGLPALKKLVLSVSSNERRKNLPSVSRVIDLLGGEYKLVRIGPPLRDSIGFFQLDRLTVAKLYGACDVLLFPTLEEGFGYPVVEAFAAGLPVVCSDIEVMREIAGEAAILENAKDISGLADGVRRAINDPDTFTRLGKKRSELFGFERFKRELEVYLHSLTEEAS